MNRRSFLKGIGAGLVAAQASIKLLKDYPINGTVINGDWIVDSSARTIAYNGPSDKYFSTRDLYMFLKNEWLQEEQLRRFPFPMTAVSNEHMILESEWIVTNNSFSRMHGGCLELQNGDCMTSLSALGTVEPDTRIEVVQDGKLLSDWVNPKGVIKIEPHMKELTFVNRDPNFLPGRFSTTEAGFDHIGNSRQTICYPLVQLKDPYYRG